MPAGGKNAGRLEEPRVVHQDLFREGDKETAALTLEQQEEGIFVGLSAGATLTAALQVAEKAEPGSTLLAMMPDTGERYLSTYLFEDLNEGSDDEWLAAQG